MTCGICIFYSYLKVDEYAGQIGQCRYNPPAAGVAYNMFPLVKSTAWCGKFQQKS